MSKIKVVPASKEMLAKQLREALKEITVTDERKEIVGQLVAQLMLLEDCPHLPLYFGIQAVAYTKKLSGVRWELNGNHKFAYAKVEQ